MKATSELNESLSKIRVLDQKYRRILQDVEGDEAKELWHKIGEQDKENIGKIKSYLETFSVEELAKLKKESIETIFLVIQHAGADERLRYLNILKEFNKLELLDNRKIAMMEDRILCCDQQKPQLYGTQFCGENGDFRIWEFEGSVDDLLNRRIAVGIESDFEEELRRWDITIDDLRKGRKIQKLKFR